MLHKIINKEKEEFILLAVAIVISGLLSGLGSYLGGTMSRGSTGTETKTVDNPSVASDSKVDPVTKADHIKGNLNAKVVVVEYSDPECPFCKMFHSTIASVVSEYKADQVAWVYRNLPIESLHSKAHKEAEATECAASLGGSDAFFKYYERLFEVTPSNNGLDLAELPKIAKHIGLDEESFNSCLSSGKFASKVDNLIKEGNDAGVSGTPTSFILVNNKSVQKIVGSVPKSDLEKAINNALK